MNGHDPHEIRAMDSVLAVVLGGGRGTRLYPLTAMRAKPAVPLCGRYRLVDIPLSNCIHSGISKIYVLTQFNSASLNRHIHRCYMFDSFTPGFVDILAAEQTAESRDWYQGTADAVRKQVRELRSARAKHYLVLSGDHLYHMDYRDFFATHLRTRADITVAVLPVRREAASEFGILKVRKNGRISSFVEKPKTEEQLDKLAMPPSMRDGFGDFVSGDEVLASMGVYFFRAEVLEEILREREDWIDFGHDVIPKSLRDRRVFSHLFTGFWEDIGTVRSYYEVSMQLVSPDPPFDFHGSHYRVYTRPRFLPGSRVHHAEVTDSIICEGSRINSAEIVNSIVGIRSIVHGGAKIQNSVVLGADYYESNPGGAGIPIGIGPGSHISTAIVDKNARIGNNVVIQGSRRLRDRDGEGYAIRDGIVVVMKDAVIPDDTRIG